jgi:hypothetical protein
MDNFTLFVSIMDTVASLIIIYALFNLSAAYKKPGYLAGFIIILIGIASQVYRNIIFHLSGVAPVDTDLPIWVCKDIGVFVVVLTYLLNRKKSKG